MKFACRVSQLFELVAGENESEIRICNPEKLMRKRRARWTRANGFMVRGAIASSDNACSRDGARFSNARHRNFTST
jgi:hypothetical protein